MKIKLSYILGLLREIRELCDEEVENTGGTQRGVEF